MDNCITRSWYGNWLMQGGVDSELYDQLDQARRYIETKAPQIPERWFNTLSGDYEWFVFDSENRLENFETIISRVEINKAEAKSRDEIESLLNPPPTAIKINK